MAPTLLAIDCSTEWMTLALTSGPRVWTHAEPGAARASARLVPALHELLAQAGLSLAALDAVAFGAGPGAFTGLRTAGAVAQGLGLGLGRPLLPLDSLAIVADDARAQGASGVGWVAVDARMGEAYAGRFEATDHAVHAAGAPRLVAVDALAACWRDELPTWTAGSALAALGDALPSGAAWRIEREADRGAALARVAQAAWDAGAAVDAARALPVYLRDKVALTTAERAAAAAARA